MIQISPLGVFGADYDFQQVAELAKQDATLTHPHPVCRQANALFAMAIAHAIQTGIGAWDLHEQITLWANEMSADASLMEAITGAAEAPPEDYVHQQGWILIAFRNALWQLLYASNIEEAVVDTPTLTQPSVERFLALCAVGMRFPPNGPSAC